MTNVELATRLRALAQVYDDNPEACQPYDITGEKRSLTIFCHDPRETAATLKAFGPGAKRDDNDAIRFYPANYPNVDICIFKSNVCERVKVGEREVPEEVIPAKPEQVIPAYTEEIYEWRCGSLLDAQEAPSE